MFYAPPKVGSTHTSGLIVTEVEKIEWGVFKITFDDNTDRVWLDSRRLQYAPDIELDGHLADIQDLDAILKWYDIEEICGGYAEKRICHERYPEQCTLEVMLKDGTKKRWSAVCNDVGDVEVVTTDTGKALLRLTDLRGMDVIEATLLNEYDIVDF